jgi:amino acid transporter
MRGLTEDPVIEIVLRRSGHAASKAHPLAGTIHDYARAGGFMLSLVARILVVLLVAMTLTGCAAVAGIFKAGFWVGIIIAVIVVVALFALFGRRG